jgi:pseudaminic acid biosynthesis-associated methylase
MASNTAFFARVLRQTVGVRSINEFGANIGLNLMALERLLPGVELTGVEINQKAADELASNLPAATVVRQTLLDFQPQRTWDLVFTKGVLIHTNPDKLPAVYDLLYRCSARYILLSEYYNPTPVEVSYRGHSKKLFKRDFAGEMLDRFADLQLLDYGFVYHRDSNFRQDDITWFLLEKSIRKDSTQATP